MTTEGGIHAKRGFEFEARALLTYILVRTMTEREIDVTFEKGEDATFSYPATANRPAIVEFVQCKKREKPRLASEGTVIDGRDPWFPDKVYWRDLLDWIDTVAEGVPLLQRLENPSYRYTVLLFGMSVGGVERFFPGGLAEAVYLADPTAVARFCRVDHEHVRNPDQDRDIRPQSAARRIRVVPFPSPKILNLWGESILRDQFKLGPTGAEKVYSGLLERVRHLYQAGDVSNRQLKSVDVRSAIESGKESKGAWQRGTDLLNERTTFGGIGEKRPTDAEVLRDNKFWRHNYLQQAGTLLFDHHAVLVTGAVAAGKTTVCKYLIHEFLRRFGNRETYYLDVRSGVPLEEELAFFRRQLSLPTLFVIDNEQYDRREIRNFVEIYSTGPVAAYLVVTSTRNYHVSQFNVRDEPLDALNSVKIDDFTSESFDELFEICMGDLAPQQRSFVANARQLTRGRIGLVVAFGRCFQGRAIRLASDKIAETARARQAVSEWIEDLFNYPTKAELHDHIVPLLALASYGIPLPADYARQYIFRLVQVGILHETANGRFAPEEISIPFLVWRQNRDSFPKIVADYVRGDPEELSIVCQRLAVDGNGQSIVRMLMKEQESLFVTVLRDAIRKDPATLLNLMSAMYRCSRECTFYILQLLLSPEGQVNEGLARDLLEFDHARAIGVYDQILSRWQRDVPQPTRELFQHICVTRGKLSSRGEAVIRTCVDWLSDADASLRTAFGFIRTVRSCHGLVGSRLLAAFQASTFYNRKKVRLFGSSTPVLEIVRCCRVLRSRSKFLPLFREYADEVALERVVKELRSLSQSHAVFLFLRELRTTFPRLAKDTIRNASEAEPQWFRTMLTRSSDVTVAVALLREIRAIDGRIAFDLALAVEEPIARLTKHVSDQFRLAASISASRMVSYRLARAIAQQVDFKSLVAAIEARQERQIFIGETLYTYADVWPAILPQVLREIDVPALYARLDQRDFLVHFTFLTRGLVQASRAGAVENDNEPVVEFIEDVVRIDQVIDRLRDSMQCPVAMGSAPKLQEVAFAFSALLEVGVAVEDLRRLFGIDNAHSMIDRIHCWIGAYGDLGGMRLFLYAMGLLPERLFADEALDVATHALTHRKRPDEEGIRLNNLTETGDFLRIAAAIDEVRAAEFARKLDVLWIVAEARRDLNLGHHAVLIQGLQSASRSLCAEVASKIYGTEGDEDSLVSLIEENESIDNVVHLITVLRKALPDAARRLLKVAIDVGQERIQALLDFECDLTSASRWLRTSRDHPDIVTPDFLDSTVQSMLSARRYDTRLFSRIEAALALVDSGRTDDAEAFVTEVLDSADQTGAFRSPWALARLFLRVSYLDKAVDGNRCLEAVLRHITPSGLGHLLRQRDHALASSFLYYLAQRHLPAVWAEHQLVFERARADITRTLRNSGWLSTAAILTEIFLDSDGDAIFRLLDNIPVEQIRDMRPWELGLIETIYAGLYTSGPDPFVDKELSDGLDEAGRDEFVAGRKKYFTDDMSNSKYALALRSSLDRRLIGFAEDEVRENCSRRRSGEDVEAIKFLLNPDEGAAGLDRYPYYIRVMLDETLFTVYQFDWSEAAASEVSRAVFTAAESAA